MNMNTSDGSFNKFITLESADESLAFYEHFGSIYFDVSDYRDSLPYYYTAFLKDDVMHLLRVKDLDEDEIDPTIDWDFKFDDYSEEELLDYPLLNRKEPNFIVPVSKDITNFYMIGQYRGKGSVMQLSKRDASLEWHAQFE